MLFFSWFSGVSLLTLFILTFLLLVGSIELGAFIGRRSTSSKQLEHQAPLGTLVGSLLGLLAFLLAFTFGMTASRFDSRKELMLSEANTISTLYHSAALAPAREGGEIRHLLKKYIELRLDLSQDNIEERIEKSMEIHRLLRAQLKQLMTSSMDTDFRSSFIEDMNKLFNLHQSRKTIGLQYRIPPTIWWLLYFLSVVSLIAVGYQTGCSSSKRLRATPILALAFSMVITVIADIDRPGEGQFRVSTQPLKDVHNIMLTEESYAR